MVRAERGPRLRQDADLLPAELADRGARPGSDVVQAAVDCCFFPLYEIEHGLTSDHLRPRGDGQRIPVADWLGMMGKTKHLCKPENTADALESIEAEVERRWQRLKAMHESPLL